MGAIISPCGLYRYRLDRFISGEHGNGTTAVIMVNPSTANAVENDATIRKLIGFARENKWSRIIVGNLFAYRATDVRELGKAADPVGPDNDPILLDIIGSADRVIYAWGPLHKQPKYLRHRWRQVDALVRTTVHEPLCIGKPAKCGHPKHPLMQPYRSELLPWNPPGST